ncbi:MAG: MerR family transcriptional regulator [Alphaproteobacteria bacterium]|nr:MerR family transcriptional regulator [Alphaproteobacteria bacterium]MDE2133988.1 MerR family transcriptional regulator [Alphaproteobacteria bacterium]MDE2630488.1 MerR family transcriptional regulator [Alphaproteobacteria bacterium]
MLLGAAQLAVRTKSPEAFRTISEVAGELDVPQHVLRFWESRFAQVRPVKRAGGRRYYRPEDVDLLRGIRALLYSEGYTIKGVQKVLRERGLRFVAEVGRGETVAESAVAEPEMAERFAARVVRLDRDTPQTLAEEERVKLEILLAELLRLKSRLQAAQRVSGG